MNVQVLLDAARIGERIWALNSRIRFRGLYGLVFFLPLVTMPVASATVWRWLYAPDVGLFNRLLAPSESSESSGCRDGVDPAARGDPGAGAWSKMPVRPPPSKPQAGRASNLTSATSTA